MFEVTRPMLAAIKILLAEMFSHTDLGSLFQAHNFEANGSFTNKVSKCSAFLDHVDFKSEENRTRLLDLISDARAQRYRSFETFEDGPADEFALKMRRFNEQLESRGILWVDDRYVESGHSAVRSVKVKMKVDLSLVYQEVKRARDNADRDPSDAITAAEGIFVSTCKHILEEREVEYSKNVSAQELLNLVLADMSLLPDNISDKAKGAEHVRKILRSMMPVVQGISELRNLYGDAHGKAPGFKGLEGRHARFLICAAEGVASFLLETHSARPKTKN